MKQFFRHLAIALLLIPLAAATATADHTNSFSEPVKLIAKGSYLAALPLLPKFQDGRTLQQWHNAIYLKGYSLLKLNQLKEAREEFLKIQTDRLVGDWATYHLAEIASEQKHHEEVITYGKRLKKNFAHSPLRNQMTMLHAKALIKTGKMKKGMTLVENLIGKKTKNEDELLWELANYYESTGRHKKAYATYQRIYYSYPHLPKAEMARKATLELRKKYKKTKFPRPTYQMVTKRVKTFMKNGQLKDAIWYITRMAPVGWLNGEQKAQLRLKQARAYKRSGKTAEAIRTHRQILISRKSGRARNESLYKLARLLWNRGESASVKELLGKLIKQYPRGSRTATAHYILGRLYESEGNYQKSAKNLTAAYKRFPATETAEIAMWRLGWLHYQNKKYAKAEAVFKHFVKKYPFSDHLPKIIYWQARSEQRQNKTGKQTKQRLVKNHPFSYYALTVGDDASTPIYMATSGNYQNMGGLHATSTANLEARIKPLLKNPNLTSLQFWLLETSENWAKLGRKDIARSRFGKLARKLPNSIDNIIWLSWQSYRAGDYQSVMKQFWKVTGKKVKSKEAREVITMLMFPMPEYWDDVLKAASKHKIDPMLILSVIRQESGFNPKALSSADARGLMQIIPKTGKKISRSLMLKNYSPKKLFEAKTNIKMGAFYLSWLIKQMDGHLIPAIASYNAGKYKVKKWVERFPNSSREEFIEKIPYPETRGYVKKVLRNYGIYRATYGNMAKLNMANNSKR